MRILSLALLCLFAAACSSAATPPTITPTPTDAPVTPAPALPSPGDGAAYGRLIFNTFYNEVGFACITCHYPESEARFVGPGLRNLSTRVAAYDTGLTVEQYLRAAIIAPDAFVAPYDPPYSLDLMPDNYAALFSEQELNDLVAYLLTL